MSRIGSTQRAAVERANRKAVQRRRVRQRLRVVAATAPGLAAGALAMALATPHAVAEVAPAGAMQSVIDQLLDAQQKIIDTNSDYPFIVPSDLSSLQGYTQNLAITTLLLGLNKLNTSSDSITWVPFPWSANVAEPQSPLILPNPDDQYGPIAVDPTATYTVTVNPGAGTQDLSFTANAGNGVTVDFTPVSSLDLADATPNADGTYTIILSATPHDGNWVDISGVGTVMIRNIMGDGGLPHDYITIHQDGATAASSLPELSHDQMITMLGQLAAIMPLVNASGTYYSQMEIPDSLPDNTMTDISATSGAVEGISTPGQISSMGHFELGPDQALIIKAPNLEAGYFGLQLYNDWGQNVPYVTAQGGLNNTQIFQDSDGYTYYVVSSKDPGVANWVDNSSLTDGIVGLRWQNVTGDVTNPDVQTQVVNIADVKDYLPSDTPLVTAEERAALLQERLFDYGYTQDQDHNIDWLGWNLVYNQFKAAMGPEAFEQIFGGQTDVPTVLDRMTDPSLMPQPRRRRIGVPDQSGRKPGGVHRQSATGDQRRGIADPAGLVEHEGGHRRDRSSGSGRSQLRRLDAGLGRAEQRSAGAGNTVRRRVHRPGDRNHGGSAQCARRHGDRNPARRQQFRSQWVLAADGFTGRPESAGNGRPAGLSRRRRRAAAPHGPAGWAARR
ncbi:hypothetical protein EHH44_15740 [Mycolicibacter terrae]|uniref:Uncharacterized protein n=1 Tax=Mycolicibacter terrae TaxID=1788 RepID=A0ACD2EKC5_9MYCO|nr:hypothetical protein [Mycolicibacter terrae]RRR42886.1 hypothetical protein EHH44_15740 [Mycolicibacter terrae]